MAKKDNIEVKELRTQLEQDKSPELPPIPPPPTLTGGNVIIFPKRGGGQRVRGWGDE